MYTFYFDMDNVLADFESRIPKYAIDTNRPSDQLDEIAKEQKRRMWRQIEQTPTFWRNLPMIYGVKNMLHVAKSHGNMYVLSKTPKTKNFVRGASYVKFIADEKTEWILCKLGDFFDKQHIIIICDSNKEKLIQPTKNDILIDDRIDNVNAWCKSGGRGLHFIGAQDAIMRLKNEKFM